MVRKTIKVALETAIVIVSSGLRLSFTVTSGLSKVNEKFFHLLS